MFGSGIKRGRDSLIHLKPIHLKTKLLPQMLDAYFAQIMAKLKTQEQTTYKMFSFSLFSS